MIDFGRNFEELLRRIFILWIPFILFVSLGIWKAAELAIWVWRNVHIVIGGAE